MSRRSLLIMALPLALACGDDAETQDNPDASTDTTEGNWETHRSALERELSPDVAPADLEAVATANRAISLDLFGRIAPSGQNAVASPFSIQLAFALLYPGARGQTADEMATTLGFVGDAATFHRTMNSIDLALSSRNLDATADDDAVALRVANSFWGQDGLPWRADYLDILALNYGAAVYGIDFGADPLAARDAINGWVSDHTGGRISDLLPVDAVSAATVAVLTNALYLKAPWAAAFDPDATSDGAFTLLDESSVTVPMMHQLEDYPFAAGDGWTALDMPLRGDDLSVLFILPDAGTFEAFETGFDGAQLDEIIAALSVEAVSVALPRFRVESGATLRDVLAAMGMPTVFAGADLSGMLDGGGLFVSEAFHRAFVEVNEQGVEAAAATAVVVDRGGMGESFTANRPFFFVIRDRPTNIALFVGRVLNPSL